jgi:Uma2 family endonuclease
MPTGYRPSRVASRLFRSLDDFAEQTRSGFAFNDNLGFAVPELSSGRQSFSPDASYYDGPLPANLMRFIEGPPTLAIEVRSEGDYTPSAQTEMAAKRLDYFEAGTAVVWDVDPIAETITAYRSTNPDAPVVYNRGQVAEAEPVVSGWRVDVAWVFG